ncbi:iron ABC transporter permease [Gracilibacillus caseinilyticus]|uniref:Iron ABC transporter permease n=1 Tax=Gracilibacillus caseinilyticus TaxID=2932256 RepID=A0ABY4F147_9BACI|nr:iron ABC transporter permease [Gracilibacillus caseinilyticus]UOQ50407.1 iron ABC transporter permease [Gracilibacillus caseinilyticus]
MVAAQTKNGRRLLYIYLVLVLVLFGVVMLSLSMGAEWISPLELWRYFTGQTEGQYDFTIYMLRLPRVLLAIVVGSCLAVAGLILQSIIRNPLASPDIIGVTAGGSVGAMVFLVLFMGTITIIWLPLFAISGAAIVMILIYGLSWKNGVTPNRLVLIGIGIAAAMQGLVSFMIVFSDTSVTTKAYIWMTGSIYGAVMKDVYQLLPWAVLGILMTVMLARTVSTLELGDELATSLGVRVQLIRLSLLILSVLLAGSAVAFAGGIGFVGLIAPHIAKKLISYSFVLLVPITAVIGAIMVAVSDLVARTAFYPLDLPAGVFTAAIGAPFFIYLLYRNRYHN